MPEGTAEQVEQFDVKALLEEMGAEAADVIPADIVRKADLSLPGEYRLDILAQELLSILTGYHKAEVAYRAAKNSGDRAETERLVRMTIRLRLTAALIMAENPGVKALADEFATLQAAAAKRNRAESMAKNRAADGKAETP